MRLGDVAREVRATEKKPLEVEIDRFVGLEHLDPEELKISRWGNVADGTTFIKKFTAGQILFGRRRAYQKKAAIADFDGICSGDITVIEAIPGKVAPELLPYIIQNDEFFEYAVNESAGSLSPRAKWKHLAEYVVNLPSLEKQKKIAELMHAFDDSVESKRNIINSLNMTKTKLFSFDTENTKLTSFGEMFYLRRELTETTNEQTKYVALEDIESQTGNLLSFGKASDAISIKSKFYVSDILFGKLRPYLRKYWIATDKGVCSTEILVLTCKDCCIPQFGFYALQNEDFIQFAINNSFGTKMPRVNWEKLSEFRMNLPNISEQKRIVEELEKVDKLIDEVKLIIDLLSQMKKRISKILISGGDHQ